MDEVVADRDWADQWVRTHTPVPLIDMLEEGEAVHAQLFASDYGRLKDQFEVAYGAYAGLIDDLNFINKATWPGHRAVQYVLLAKTAKSFHTALDCLVRGRYEDCVAIVRGLYETFVRNVWISAHPDSAYNPLVKSPPAREPTFNLTNFLRDQLHLDWEVLYSVMSAIAHSNGGAALSSLIRAVEREGEPERFQVAVEYDKDRLELAGPLLVFVLLTHLRFATTTLVGNLAHPAPERLALANEAVMFFTKTLETHSKPFWPRIAADLDMVFELISVADRGNDWKAWLDARRSGPT